jgi:hypothetical protein
MALLNSARTTTRLENNFKDAVNSDSFFIMFPDSFLLLQSEGDPVGGKTPHFPQTFASFMPVRVAVAIAEISQYLALFASRPTLEN